MRRPFRFELTIFAFVFLLSTPTVVYADRGMIPIQPEVSVYEPGQKAIIAWNGREEILILSTDVLSNGETFVLEMLPLPSNPSRVELASFKSFEEINKKIWGRGFKTYGERSLKVEEGVEIVFREKIGTHDITIVKAADTSELVRWMTVFLRNSNITKEVSLQNFEPVVEDYMARGFRYYVLDIITVSPEQRSVEPILYRFNTSFLYYPLKITSPVGGNTQITLFILTEGSIQDGYHPLRMAGYQTPNGWEPIKIWLSSGELSKIDIRIGGLLNDGAWLTVLTYNGRLDALTDDLMIAEEAITPTNQGSTPLGFIIALSVILGATCTLAGVVTTFLIMRSKERAKHQTH
ncbi:MAG: hypothetical protein AOA65_1408 [Candidatus Bathyarchaeota archaeon BA1]|nr:MAG: hypothetical protein AOA65_1408 [Candidatus Bathyarchaeota archaeon BA1]